MPNAVQDAELLLLSFLRCQYKTFYLVVQHRGAVNWGCFGFSVIPFLPTTRHKADCKWTASRLLFLKSKEGTAMNNGHWRSTPGPTGSAVGLLCSFAPELQELWVAIVNNPCVLRVVWQTIWAGTPEALQ